MNTLTLTSNTAMAKEKIRTQTWRDVLKIHPAAEAFPRLSAPNLAQLGADIKKNGLLQPIAMWSPGDPQVKWPDRPMFVLDGISRLDAMEAEGLLIITDGKINIAASSWHLPGGGIGKLQFERHYEFKTMHTFAVGGTGAVDKQISDVDPYAYVISANLHRRHLTPDRKRDLVELLIKKTNKGNRSIAKLVGVHTQEVAKVRETVQVSQATHLNTTINQLVGRDNKSYPASGRVPEDKVAEIKQFIKANPDTPQRKAAESFHVGLATYNKLRHEVLNRPKQDRTGPPRKATPKEDTPMPLDPKARAVIDLIDAMNFETVSYADNFAEMLEVRLTKLHKTINARKRARK